MTETTPNAAREDSKSLDIHERIDVSELRIMLQQWIDSIEVGKDVPVTIRGHSVTIPSYAFREGFDIELDFEEDEYALDLKLRWRNQSNFPQ
jgi:hypothetical protein